MVITPRISEKAYNLAKQNIYVFNVPLSANKAEVLRAIAVEYPEIEIADVRLVVAKGKVKAVNRGKHARPGQSKRSNTKKAYVTVSKGSIELFKEQGQAESEEA